jgi:hypothetical protein
MLYRSLYHESITVKHNTEFTPDEDTKDGELAPVIEVYHLTMGNREGDGFRFEPIERIRDAS